MWVDSGYFFAGAVWSSRMPGATCTHAAPILKWMVGKRIEEVHLYMKRKNWKAGWCRPSLDKENH